MEHSASNAEISRRQSSLTTFVADSSSYVKVASSAVHKFILLSVCLSWPDGSKQRDLDEICL